MQSNNTKQLDELKTRLTEQLKKLEDDLSRQNEEDKKHLKEKLKKNLEDFEVSLKKDHDNEVSRVKEQLKKKTEEVCQFVYAYVIRLMIDLGPFTIRIT